MPARRTQGPHVHGYRATLTCDNELCRAYWRGYMAGYRKQDRDKRTANAEAIARLRASARDADHEDGPVRRTRTARPDGGRPVESPGATRAGA